jgi:nitric oxide reductase subunit C
MPGKRLFFLSCLIISLALVAATLPSVLQTRAVPPEVETGLMIWRANHCEGCHTLYGQGGAYAPDLTHIYRQRGEGYLREFLINPQAFHPGQRQMLALGLTDGEVTSLLTFLAWVGAQEPGLDWPPRPIQVRGGGATSPVIQSPTELLSDDPIARGKALFSSPPAICSTCHSVEPQAVIVGPSLAGIAATAATRVPGQSAELYIRNSILNPSEYLVEGFQDVMQKNFGSVLTAEQINDVIAYLMTLE